MIRIEIYRTLQGEINGFQVKGHAGMAEKGQDIVCAAVSVLTQTVVLGLTKYLGLQPKVKRKDGYLACLLSQREQIETDTVQAIFETMALGLEEIVGQYPDFVRMEEHRR